MSLSCSLLFRLGSKELTTSGFIWTILSSELRFSSEIDRGCTPGLGDWLSGVDVVASGSFQGTYTFRGDGACRYDRRLRCNAITKGCSDLSHGTRLACLCLHSNSHWNCVSRQVLTDFRDGTFLSGADYHGNRDKGIIGQISMPVMVVTLLAVFDGLKDHG